MLKVAKGVKSSLALAVLSCGLLTGASATGQTPSTSQKAKSPLASPCGTNEQFRQSRQFKELEDQSDAADVARARAGYDIDRGPACTNERLRAAKEADRIEQEKAVLCSLGALRNTKQGQKWWNLKGTKQETDAAYKKALNNMPRVCLTK